jgi:3',5'-cyclic AMP phosphodiesterase CpdA
VHTFRLLHVSDLHVNKHRSIIDVATGVAYQAYKAENLARLVHEWRDRLDLILISGDLAHVGDPDTGLRMAEHLCTAAPSGPVPWLTTERTPTLSHGVPIHLLPGNHDRFGYLRDAGGRAFDPIFYAFWSAGQGAQTFPPLASPDGADRLAIVAADFSLAFNSDETTPGGRWGQGRVYTAVLDKLIAQTNALRDTQPPPAVVWAIHFPPAFAEVDDALSLIDDSKVLDAADGLQIPAIFAGHTHQARQYHPAGPDGAERRVEVLCAGAATTREPRNGNSVHYTEIDVHAASIVAPVRWQTLPWDEAAQSFVAPASLQPQ